MSDGSGSSRLCNIASALTTMAEQQPYAPAIIFPHGRDASGRVAYLTYRQLDDESSRIAKGLEKIGLGRGVRVVLMVKPSLEFFALTFALFKAGTVPVMIDPGIDLKALKQCLAEAEPEGFIGIPKAHVARIILGWAKSAKKLVTVGRRLFWGGYTLEQVKQLGSDGQHYSMAATLEDEVAAILFTSGSTGIPKGAVYRHGNFIGQVEKIRQAYDIRPGEIDLPTFPLFALFDPALGMTTVIPDMDAANPAKVDPAKLHEAIENFGVTNMFGSPAVLKRIVEYGKPLPKTLNRVLSAGASVRPVILDGMTKLLPPGVQVHTPYGATESLPVATIGSAEILGETRYLTDKGAGICVGRPNAGVQVDIIEITDEPIADWSAVKILPPGQVGEIVARSPTVTSGYFNREKQTALAKVRGPHGETAHRMGDVGYFDEHGRLWFCGRKSHRVVTPKGTLFTEQVEGVFNANPWGFRTALVGVTRNGATEPVLCVEVAGVLLRLTRPLAEEFKDIGQRIDLTKSIQTILVHQGGFPVDIRHNAKIFRENLAVWAAEQLK
jgi:acyl-CoA synthetase (AMP-forming)/AMP-acid ligase II